MEKKPTAMQENLFTPDCIRTYTGKYVNVFNPTEDMFCIEDIAHALSMMPRFGGHLPVWYSVADHCISAVNSFDVKDKLDVLMHDCSEAYLMDICSPIKKKLGNYYEIEDGLMKVLSKKFGFNYPLSDEVKRRDAEMLQDEWDNIMLGEYPATMVRTPQQSKRLFMQLYYSLTQTYTNEGNRD